MSTPSNDVQADVPVEVSDLRESLKRLDRRDWGLWFTAIIILLLLCFAVYSLTQPAIRTEDQWLIQEQIAIGERGLFGLVLLFAVFAMHQQYMIKKLRSKLQEQIGVVTELHSRAETFQRLSILDPLTGLFNRRFAYEHLPREIARAERSGTSLILLMIDLNDFKTINDTYGHAAGDAALEAFARHLKRGIRSADLPVRMGGDEFMVALPDCSVEQVIGPLKRIEGCALDYNGNHIEITFSVGMAQHRKGDTVVQLLERGDSNMYAMKQGNIASPRDWFEKWRAHSVAE
ncbi:MAG: GGDEF domain-containing protein [Terriglobales bacterium]